jgi:hypothetical protein
LRIFGLFALVPFHTFHESLKGGVNVSGKLWGREQDNIGIGYGYLEGGNTGVDKTQVVEGCIRSA